MESFDRLMLDFLAATKAPGAALAVGRDGRLLYVRGFGWADVQARQAVQPRSLFRIASLSKPITAVAVLQLVQAGRLGLDDRVADLLRLPLDSTCDSRWRQITIRHLLQHSGGFDRSGGDPMGLSRPIAQAAGAASPATAAQIIAYMIRRPLDFDPGSRSVYSNFGYCLLGRVIEKLTARDYAASVRQAVLEPCGAGSMRLGRSLEEGRADGEVRYYSAKGFAGESAFGPPGRSVPGPYGTFCLEAMDSHGGWLASAGDLVRFAMALDHPLCTGGKCLLSSEALKTLFAPPALKAPTSQAASRPDPNVYYACGWMVRHVGRGRSNAWHTGGLSGTSTLLVRRHDRWVWAALFNSDCGADGHRLSTRLDPLVHGAADRAARALDSLGHAPQPPDKE